MLITYLMWSARAQCFLSNICSSYSRAPSDTNSSQWSLKYVDYRLGCSWDFYGFSFHGLGFFSQMLPWKGSELSRVIPRTWRLHWSPAFQDSTTGQCQIPMRAAARAGSSVWGRMGTFCEQKTEGVCLPASLFPSSPGINAWLKINWQPPLKTARC